MTARSGAGALLAALLALTIAGATPATPASRSRVAVVRTSTHDPLLREARTRLRAELTAAGFQVLDVARAPGDPRSEVESTAAHTDSFATVSIDRADSGAFADVWINDRITGKTVVRRLDVAGTSNAAAVLAIRAMELLRASLLELASVPSSSARPSAAPRDVLDWVEPAGETGPSWRAPFAGPAIHVGVLGLHTFAGVGPAIGPVVRASHGIGDHAFGRLTLAAPVVGASERAPEGSADVTQLFSALDLGWATRTRPVSAFLWAGLGAFYLHTRGAAEPPYRSTRSSVVSFLATAGIGGSARLSDAISCSIEAAAVGLVPQPVIVIADREVAAAGTPSVSLSLGLSVAL